MRRSVALSMSPHVCVGTSIVLRRLEMEFWPNMWKSSENNMKMIWNNYETIWGVWTYILDVWTFILGAWTYIWVSDVIFWVSELISWVSGPIFNCLDLYFGCPDRRAGRRLGRVTQTLGGKIVFGNTYSGITWYCLYYWMLTLGYFYKKRHSPKNDGKRRDKCPEISHIRPV